MQKREEGFTLIEIAIVLVIIGLLLGGVLKGQELITGARVRNIVQQQDGVKAAYFGFLDRYRALPGDYSKAVGTITGMSTANCNGGNGSGDGQISATNNEDILAWEHLSKAGFINGTYVCNSTASPTTSPTNPYGQYLSLIWDKTYGDTAALAADVPSRHNLKSGGSIPSDLLAEIDRKVDDGNAKQGSFRAMTGVSAAETDCYSAAGAWVATPGFPNCGGTTLF
jgi:prepilin-type N-terminal cleavage/methylation domain-containing protein